MEAIRKVVDSNKLSVIMDLPNSMKNRQVEVIILPVAEKDKAKTSKSMKGVLNRYADTKLEEQEKGAWEKAMVQKYGNL